MTSSTSEFQDDRSLLNLRAELDAIDDRLRDALRRRIDCCVRIARYKRTYSIPMMQPRRIGVVQAHAARYAEMNGIDPLFMRLLYELIIAETCRVENAVINKDREEV